jgi:hypothetical protein
MACGASQFSGERHRKKFRFLAPNNQGATPPTSAQREEAPFALFSAELLLCIAAQFNVSVRIGQFPY